jgi:hypothetical protein
MKKKFSKNNDDFLKLADFKATAPSFLDYFSPQLLDFFPLGVLLIKAKIEKGALVFRYHLLNNIVKKYSGLHKDEYLNQDVAQLPGIFPFHYLMIFKSIHETGEPFKDVLEIVLEKKICKIEVTCLKCTEGLIIFLNDITKIIDVEIQFKKNEKTLLDIQHIAGAGSFEWNFYEQSLICTEEIYNFFRTRKGC